MSIIVGTSNATVTPSRPASLHLSMLNQSCGMIEAPTASTVYTMLTPAVCENCEAEQNRSPSPNPTVPV